MNLPDKTFLKKQCRLFESDFECNSQLKPHRAMQLMQDAATEHAVMLNVGWDNMDRHGLLWVLSKVDIRFNRPITRKTPLFDMYTWPLAPNRFFSERCFVAEQDGEQIFCATTLWMLIDRDSRKIVSAERMNEFFHGDYSEQKVDGVGDFVRLRFDETFCRAYTKTVRRSDLDINGHVNNTNYVTYALDVLGAEEKVKSVQIVYHKELVLGDEAEVYFKREQSVVSVLGVRNGETCFSVLLQLAE
ncbi:MAG: thioesterase [Corallococcus sp.]|nr:thioesterase [Corallococcus sp.]MCM1358944.1 thioesterase [Corallococcus sp.]MCM1394932.1 thioesterase [Corallococcus sp.]